MFHQEVRVGREKREKRTLVIEDENLRGGFSQIPNVVLRNPLLGDKALRLYTLLLSYAWQEEECFPGQETLAKDMGCTRKSITNALNELKKHKLIDWQRRGLGKVNIYHIKRLSDGYLPKSFVDRGNDG